MKQRKHRNSGMSMLYVLAALIVTGFIGTALLKVSTGDRISNAHYSTSASARSAALSGMIFAIEKFENPTHSVNNLLLLNKWIKAESGGPFTAADRWYVGMEDGYYTLPNINLEAKVEILAFDKARQNITLRSEGKGTGGSRASITSVYYLDGLDFEEVEEVIEVEEEVEVETDWGEENAFFLGDGLSLDAHSAFDITGDVYIGSGTDIYFDSYVSGSTFQGNFIIAKANSAASNLLRFDGSTITFEGPAYFGTRPNLTGSATLNFDHKVGFEWGVKMKKDSIELGNTAYWNYRNDADQSKSGEIDQNTNKIYHNGQFNYLYRADYGGGAYDDTILTHNGSPAVVVNSSEMTTANKVKIPDSLGINMSQCEIQVHPEVIDESFITDWTDGSATNFTGALANTMYGTAPKWNGFMVLRLQSALSLVGGGDKFSGQMIVLVNGNRIYATGTGAMSCEPYANFTIIGNGGTVENIGGWSYYRGLMWAGPGCDFIVGGAPPAASNIHGAIYAVPGATNMEWYPPGGSTSFLEFDPTVLEDLDHDGFITKENCDATSNDDETETETVITIITTTTTVLVQTDAVIVSSLVSQSM